MYCFFMKKYYFLLPVITFLIAIPVIAEQYGVYTPENYHKNLNIPKEKLLFILDFSNSMTDSIGNSRKVDMMLATMKKVLPTIDNSTPVGLRVYGHKFGITPTDACKATNLITPIDSNNIENIEHNLKKLKPRGMTPITYSLKQAIANDFIGYSGKKHIILLTDGGENCDESPCKFAMNLIKYRKDVSIDVIAFNINNEEDLEQLKCTALVTSGKFHNAQTEAQLYNGFKNSINANKNVEAKIILP